VTSSWSFILQLIQNISFIAAPITAALSHRGPASTATYLVSCSAQDSDKTKAIYLVFFACTFRPNKTARNSFEILCAEILIYTFLIFTSIWNLIQNAGVARTCCYSFAPATLFRCFVLRKRL